MDILLQAAQAFEQLLKKKYIFELGKQGTLYKIDLVFTPYEFHHLAGLHKLDDIKILHKDRRLVFKEILKRKLTCDDINESSGFKSIQKRLELIVNLEHYLDTVNSIFKYDHKKNMSSKIRAEYVMKNTSSGNEVFYFAIKEKQAYVGVSLFAKDVKDYTDRQIKLKLLKKEKVHCESGIVEKLFPIVQST